MLLYLQMLETPEEKSLFEQIYLEYRGLMYHVAYEILHNDQDAEDDIRKRTYDSAEGEILRRERRDGGDDQHGGSKRYIRSEGRDYQADACMAALEVIVDRIEPAESQAEARKRAPRLSVTLDAEKDAADENGDQILHKLN